MRLMRLVRLIAALARPQVAAARDVAAALAWRRWPRSQLRAVRRKVEASARVLPPPHAAF